ncbi:hypothetical protein FACS189472_01280 [Alphaproteobacteria bacterium]|nr:hypothetical protein FACS189472_01280 [Alphaproteobacteria bacterium]
MKKLLLTGLLAIFVCDNCDASIQVYHANLGADGTNAVPEGQKDQQAVNVSGAPTIESLMAVVASLERELYTQKASLEHQLCTLMGSKEQMAKALGDKQAYDADCNKGLRDVLLNHNGGVVTETETRALLSTTQMPILIRFTASILTRLAANKAALERDVAKVRDEAQALLVNYTRSIEDLVSSREAVHCLTERLGNQSSSSAAPPTQTTQTPLLHAPRAQHADNGYSTLAYPDKSDYRPPEWM